MDSKDHVTYMLDGNEIQTDKRDVVNLAEIAENTSDQFEG